MHGGIKVYRGSAAAARHYVEADRSRADDYYLAEASGLADRFVVYPDGLLQRPAMDGDTYERWVAGYDVETGKPKGRLRTDENAVRFIEIVVAAKVNLPRPVKGEQRYLTHSQVEDLAQATGYPADANKHSNLDTRTNEMYRLVVLFLAYTGVRFGEMAALK
jgi:integrase